MSENDPASDLNAAQDESAETSPRNQRDLTRGPVFSTLIRFTVPFFAANLLQALYGAVDLLIVGRFASGVSDVAAVACGSQVMTIVAMAVIGLTTAGTVLIGKFYGAKDLAAVRRTIGTMLVCFLICAFFLTGMMFAVASALLRFLQTPPEAFAAARRYIDICSAGTIFIFGYNAFSAVLRGVGNSRSPMIFIGIACLVNLLADLLLVGVFSMGPAGAAYATIGSQAVSMVFAIVYIRRQKFLFDFRLSSFKIDRPVAKKLFIIGLPLSIQSTLIDFSFMLIFSIVNTMGVAASAGYGICCRINGFTMLPSISLGMALTAMVAQNLGAGKPERAIQAFRWGIVSALSVAGFFFCWMEFWPESAFRLFSHEPEVVAAGALYMKSFCFDVLLVAFVFCANGLLNGSGHTRFTFVNNVVPTFLLRVPVAWYISRLPGATLYGVGWAAPLASALSVVITLIYLRTGRWKLPRL